MVDVTKEIPDKLAVRVKNSGKPAVFFICASATLHLAGRPRAFAIGALTLLAPSQLGQKAVRATNRSITQPIAEALS